MATEEQITELRAKLGELIPTGGVEADTMFSNVIISNWIDASSSLNEAALSGWEAKLAQVGNLVNVTDGAASRELSDLFDHAERMVSIYTRKIRNVNRTRIGKITRPL